MLSVTDAEIAVDPELWAEIEQRCMFVEPERVGIRGWLTGRRWKPPETKCSAPGSHMVLLRFWCCEQRGWICGRHKDDLLRNNTFSYVACSHGRRHHHLKVAIY